MHLPPRPYLWLLPVVIVGIALLWPLPRSFVYPEARKAVQVLDRHGELLYEVRPEDFGSHKFLTLEDMPQSFLHAVISIEDRDFYTHGGVSVKAISRAALQNVSTGKIISGGSTITQQLIRNRLQPKSRTFLYKMWEGFLAWKLDSALSKDEILESYLNTAYFGHQAYGIDAASSTFFGKAPFELSIAESALLAGMLQSPTALDPFNHPQAAKERRKRVLTAMLETKTITEEQYNDAITEPVSLKPDTVTIHAPHFVFWLQNQKPELFETASVIHTTLDLSLQRQIERIIDAKLADLKEKNVTSSAVVVLDAHNGDILSMVGSADYFNTQNQGAVNAAVSLRQPGSAIKPFTYALALSKGDTAATTVADTETQFSTQSGNPYTPRNYDFGYHGLVRYREALANSYNIAAVKVLQKVGVGPLLGFLHAAGITSMQEPAEHYGLALTLGDAEVTLLDLATAYGLFPRGGKTLSVRSVASDPIQSGKEILDPKVAWILSDILSDNSARMPEFGDDSPLAFPFPVAAKTGTTRNSRDNWTMGYTSDVIVGVWVGNNDNSPMKGTSGVTGAGPIFHDVVLAAVTQFPAKAFTEPAGITRVDICMLSGKLPTQECKNTMQEKFIAGTEPTAKDDIFQALSIDTRNGLLASSSCPPNIVQKKTFAFFPDDTAKWARENGWPQPPTVYSPLCKPDALGQTSITETYLEITGLHNGDSFALDPLIPDSNESIFMEAQASRDITSISWYVDGKKIGDANAPDFRASFTPTPGIHTVEARAGNLLKKVSIEVVASPYGQTH